MNFWKESRNPNLSKETRRLFREQAIIGVFVFLFRVYVLVMIWLMLRA
jgi:predicted nucleic acid-binding Zn ribbon protein